MGMTSSFPYADVRFSAEERAAIAAEFDRRSQPPAFEKHLWIFKLFYVLAILAVVAAAVLLHQFRDVVPVLDGSIAAGSAVVMLVLLGVMPPVFLRGAASSEAFGRAQVAVELISRSQLSDPADLLAHAVAIFALPRAPGGLWSKNPFDARQAAAKLGPSLDYVRAVERVLIEERGIKPLFNDSTTQ